jgi:hypothetical protein
VAGEGGGGRGCVGGVRVCGGGVRVWGECVGGCLCGWDVGGSVWGVHVFTCIESIINSSCYATASVKPSTP